MSSFMGGESLIQFTGASQLNFTSPEDIFNCVHKIRGAVAEELERIDDQLHQITG